MNYGYYKLFTVSPKQKIANPLDNVKEHKESLDKIKQNHNHSAIVVFPETSLTTYSCEDLFLNQKLLNESKQSLEWLRLETLNYPFIVVVGSPLEFKGKLLNCAVVLYQGEYLGIVPKNHIVNYGEFYENRWFTSGEGICEKVVLNNREVLLSSKQIFKAGELSFGIEICEDLWAPISPSSYLALAGAQLILNLSASNELVNKAEARKELVKTTSARLNCGYLYVSSGIWESSRDLVFGGHMMYCETGSFIKESEKFNLESSIMEVEIDIEKVNFERRRNKTFGSSISEKMSEVKIDSFKQTSNITRKYNKHPFVPASVDIEGRVKEVLELQAMGLVRRLMSIPKPNVVLGLSGGSDSTLAILVCAKAMQKLNLPATNIHAISMPGFGTSQRTRDQARRIAKALGVSFKEIDIKSTTQSHLNDIEHEEIDFVYENAQSRERTQILFDYSNKINGIVVGTGSLSESWANNATYGGDHLCGYNVNGSIPKTLTKFLIRHYPCQGELRSVLDAVLATTISPELLPLDKQGNIAQASEEMVGPYELHDFFIYHFIRNGFSEEKIEFLTNKTYAEEYTKEEISKWIKESFRRFRVGQFKRTCSPPGVKVGSVSLSIREARFPDDR